MVKKVGGQKPPSATGATEKTKAVEPSKVKDVKDVHAAEGKQAADRIRRPTRPMTMAEREHLFRLIHEEADKMFGPDGMPEEKREKIEGAVRMAVDGSILDEDEESEEA